MKTIIKRGLNKIQRECRAFLQKTRKLVFPLWFIHATPRKIFFYLYEKSSFVRKEYFLSEYIQKPETRWIQSNFDFEVRFHSKTIYVPIRSEFFAIDMGLALSLIGLDSEVKYIYYKIFKNNQLRDRLKILDIGANFGQNLLLFCSQSKEVTAFEPNPHCLTELGRVLSANKFTPTLINAAVGSSKGQVALKWPTGCTWCGTVSDTKHLIEMGYVELEEVNVPIVVLDQEISFSAQPVLIKIDVEGFEADVLKGGKNLLLHNDCLVIFEHDFTRADGRREIWAFLNSFGYGIYSIQSDSGTPLRGPHTLEEYLRDHRPNHAAMRGGSIFQFLYL